MKKHFYRLGLFFVYGFLWITLNEDLSPMIFLTGGILGIFAVSFTENVLLYSDYQNTYSANPFVMAKYFFYLLYQIYFSGISAVRIILSGEVHPGIVMIETEIKGDFLKCLLANSITLTPGTVTLDVEENRLKVLWINCPTKDPKEAGELIKGKLERELLKG